MKRRKSYRSKSQSQSSKALQNESFEGFDPRAYRSKRAGVIGLGRSGIATADLLFRKGFKVFGSDIRPRNILKKELGRLSSKIQWEAGAHSNRLLQCSFITKSPGLKPSLPIFKQISSKNIPIYSELETALAFSKSQNVVAITGTNGKSTTTTLTYDIFKSALPRSTSVYLTGNIGIPVSKVVSRVRSKDVYILECSSYQLEDSHHFAPRISAILNITADHLDHHLSMQDYVYAKSKIFRQQSPSDVCIFNADDPLVYKLSRECNAHRLYFGKRAAHVNAWFESSYIHLQLPQWKKPLKLKAPSLPGEHNIQNAMAAALIAASYGIKPAQIQNAFRKFKGVAHRLEKCGVVAGVECINDSKATNVDSTLVALKSFDPKRKNVLLILGGLHKGSPYTPLKPYLERNVKGIFTIGAASRRIEEDLSGTVPIFPCEDLATACKTALHVSTKGDILLLSPACASFDQFRNFEERGDHFKDLIKHELSH